MRQRHPKRVHLRNLDVAGYFSPNNATTKRTHFDFSDQLYNAFHNQHARNNNSAPVPVDDPNSLVFDDLNIKSNREMFEDELQQQDMMGLMRARSNSEPNLLAVDNELEVEDNILLMNALSKSISRTASNGSMMHDNEADGYRSHNSSHRSLSRYKNSCNSSRNNSFYRSSNIGTPTMIDEFAHFPPPASQPPKAPIIDFQDFRFTMDAEIAENVHKLVPNGSPRFLEDQRRVRRSHAATQNDSTRAETSAASKSTPAESMNTTGAMNSKSNSYSPTTTSSSFSERHSHSLTNSTIDYSTLQLHPLTDAPSSVLSNSAGIALAGSAFMKPTHRRESSLGSQKSDGSAGTLDLMNSVDIILSAAAMSTDSYDYTAGTCGTSLPHNVDTTAEVPLQINIPEPKVVRNNSPNKALSGIRMLDPKNSPINTFSTSSDAEPFEQMHQPSTSTGSKVDKDKRDSLNSAGSLNSGALREFLNELGSWSTTPGNSGREKDRHLFDGLRSEEDDLEPSGAQRLPSYSVIDNNSAMSVTEGIASYTNSGSEVNADVAAGGATTGPKMITSFQRSADSSNSATEWKRLDLDLNDFEVDAGAQSNDSTNAAQYCQTINSYNLQAQLPTLDLINNFSMNTSSGASSPSSYISSARDSINSHENVTIQHNSSLYASTGATSSQNTLKTAGSVGVVGHGTSSSLNRGNYKCGRCGQPKVNHVCAYVDEAVASVGVQVDNPIIDLRTMLPFEGERFLAVSVKNPGLNYKKVNSNIISVNSLNATAPSASNTRPMFPSNLHFSKTQLSALQPLQSLSYSPTTAMAQVSISDRPAKK